MAIDFPATPTVGQQLSAGGTVWQWDGTAWNVVPQMSPAIASDTPPTNPAIGQLWWRGSNGQLYVYVDDGNSKQWVQAAGTGSYTGDAGKVDWFAMSTPPSGWLKANGALVSRTTYANLFNAIGVLWGAGDGSTTFGLPEIRGEFPRAWDDGRGIDTGRVFGSAQLDATQPVTAQVKVAGANGGFDGASGAFYIVSSPQMFPNNTNGPTAGVGQLALDNSRVVRTASENRSRNVALLACVKY